MELTLTLENIENRMQLFGPMDRNLRIIRDFFQVHITARDDRIRLTGKKEGVNKATDLLDRMRKKLRQIDYLTENDVKQLIQEAADLESSPDRELLTVYMPQRRIAPRSKGQERYVKAILEHDLVFCTGPAGTGKTYLAVACAVSMLKSKQVRRIVLARPAVEAGEKLGFLPGDLQAKVNPYLRPLFDALGDMMEYNQIRRFITEDIIEVIPLAFMRGRTLNDSLVILDEAQNTTISQMLMFLTRLGQHSKMVVTGDDSQTDLAPGQKSGLVDSLTRLPGIKGIAFVRLTKVDIVRHRLVQSIVKAYENHTLNQAKTYENHSMNQDKADEKPAINQHE